MKRNNVLALGMIVIAIAIIIGFLYFSLQTNMQSERTVPEYVQTPAEDIDQPETEDAVTIDSPQVTIMQNHDEISH